MLTNMLSILRAHEKHIVSTDVAITQSAQQLLLTRRLILSNPFRGPNCIRGYEFLTAMER